MFVFHYLGGANKNYVVCELKKQLVSLIARHRKKVNVVLKIDVNFL